ILPLTYLIFALCFIRKLDSSVNMHRIWINATIFYAAFNIIALQIELVERIGRFFAPYPLLIIPFMLSKIKNKNIRFICMMILIFLHIAYNYTILKDSRFDPYYF